MNKLIWLALRYIFLIAIALPGFWIFYFVFTPLTTYPVYKFLHFLYPEMILSGTMLILDSIKIALIPACIAGGAYYLLFVLNFSTPMQIEKRIKSMLFMAVAFLILNIIRILIFSVFYINSTAVFEKMHAFMWYFGSTILVVMLWFVVVKLYKIESIPFYSDFLAIYSEIKRKKKKIHKN